MLMLLLLLLMLWLLEENLRVIVFFVNIIEGQLEWVVFTNSSINEFYLSIARRVFLQFFYSGGIEVCKFAMINYSRILWRGFELQFGGVPGSFQILCQSLIDLVWSQLSHLNLLPHQVLRHQFPKTSVDYIYHIISCCKYFDYFKGVVTSF